MSQDDALLRKAEDDIREILLALENHTGRLVEHVRVDTRRFSNLGVEIFFEEL
jgi:hypothetical protein